MMDDWQDHQLASALRRRADALDVGDLEAAGTSVRRRAGRRRAMRIGGTMVSIAVLAVAGVVAVRSIDGGRDVVRTPATEPAVVTTLPPAPTTTVPVTVPVVPPPTTPPPAPTTVAQTATTTTGQTQYDSLGGSITVEQIGDTVHLVGEPQPAGGYSVEVEDDGPQRVRVRFERGELRSRITVELVNGALAPQIEEE